MVLKFKDLVELLAEWDLKHVHKPRRKVDGLCFNDEKRVEIYHPQGDINARDTVIHEFLHAHYHKLGIKKTEKQIDREARATMRRLYGKDVYKA